MIRRLLIANRGEIACRIARTARDCGIQTIALASDADLTSAHVAACDFMAHLPGNTPAQTYLQGDAILAAAADLGADAIHPGYGFLSEDPDFAQSVVDAGLIWVGPPASAIRAMGLKDAAKALMEAANVPVVPGYHGADQDDGTLQTAADDIGYPVLIKAVAGGGGKGMRLVENAADFAANLASARSEAASAFGNDRVLVEKFIAAPRHIEIQVFGDGTDAVHLFERDCSLQRRHQKVIEEAPAPGMSDALRDAMGQAAVRAAKAIGYSGAGTVEFIVDGQGDLSENGFFFMEMNTRLQVEHPVTEMILGLDLVDWQLRVAGGGKLPLAQDQIQANGHAFEARIYAEDPQNGFLPSIGTLNALQFGPDLRVDTGVRLGDAVSPHYDPMIAKVVAHGADRASAMAKLEQGLIDTCISGVASNRDFLIRLVQHQGFQQGDFDTGLIARDLDDLLARPVVQNIHWAVVALAALDLPNRYIAPPYQGFAGFSSLSHHIDLTHQDDTRTIQVQVRGDTARVAVAGELIDLRLRREKWTAPGLAPYAVEKTDTSVQLFMDQTLTFDLRDPLDRLIDVKNENAVAAPMPGVVRQVFVTQGDTVADGEPLLVLEAMKMQHTLIAPRDGVLAEISVKVDDQVVAGQILAQMDETE